MRRALTVLAVAAVVGSAGVVAAGSASASVTAPAQNATLRGHATLTESPGGDDTSTLNHCGGNTSTALELVNSGGTTVYSTSNGGGTLSPTITTESYPNGTYTVRGTERDGANSGFLGIGCKSNTRTYNTTVHIDNIVSIAYAGATSAPQGTNASVSATLKDPSLGTALSGYQLTFTLSNGTPVTATTNASGVAAATLPIAGPPRSATVSVAFAGTAYFDAANVPTAFAVGKDATATTLDAPVATVHGQPAAFSATVVATQGSGTPTGSVQFAVDGSPLGGAVPLAGGHATSPVTSTLSTGTHTVTAGYAGDANFLPSSAAPGQQSVAKAATVTTLDSSANPSVHGQGVTFTAHVAVAGSGAGTPTGAVQFDVDGQPYGTAVPLAGDLAGVTVANLHTGNHTVSATYNGDADFAAGSSPDLTQGVGVAATAVVLDLAPGQVAYGAPATLTATVTAQQPGAGSPSGQVVFSIDGQPAGDPIDVTGGVASTSVTADLAPGPHTVTADYQGDGDFSGASDEQVLTVIAGATTTTVASSTDPSVFGQPVTFTADVAPAGPSTGTPSGLVQFSVDGTPVGLPVPLDHGRAVSDALAGLTTGDHLVSAGYAGDADFEPSASADLTQTVNRAATTTGLDSSANPSVFGQPVTFTATVAAHAPGAGNPTGTVTFTDGTTVLGTVAVGPETGEQATLTLGELAVASHAITATYNGDGDFRTSSGSVAQKVTRAQTETVLTSSANPAASGQQVSFTAVVAPVAPGAGTPTGSVTFTINGAPIGAPVALHDGSATSAGFASLSPGRYAVKATYSGDPEFVASAATLDEGTGQDVVKGASTLGLLVGPDPVAFGATVTLTATVAAVAPATGTPSGVVTFYDGSVLLGSASLVKQATGSAQAVLATSTLPPGSRALTATYVGNYNFVGSTASGAVQVGAVPTTTGLSASPDPVVYGQPVALTAVVLADSPAAGAPGGTVTFSDGATVLGTAVLASDQGAQRATLSVPGLGAGVHHVSASYSGSATAAGSTSVTVDVTVERAPSTLVARALVTAVPGEPGHTEYHGQVLATLTGNGAPLAGQPLLFTAKRLYPTTPGEVCTVLTDADGRAGCDTSSLVLRLALGDGYFVAFAGSADYLPVTVHQVFDGH